MAMMVRFEHSQEGEVDKDLGPFPFVQLTYDLLRVGPDGDELARFLKGFWYLRTRPGRDIKRIGPWTDVVIFEEQEAVSRERW